MGRERHDHASDVVLCNVATPAMKLYFFTGHVKLCSLAELSPEKPPLKRSLKSYGAVL